MNPLARWLRALRPDVDERRWVVLDVETTGLDVQRHEVLSVSALAMHRIDGQWSLVLQDSLDLLLRPQVLSASEDNVLLHGLGRGVQSRGLPPAQALQQLRDWVGQSPVLAFHADFDRSFLQQACRKAGAQPLPWCWLDLADVLPVVFPGEQAGSLDAWMEKLHVVCSRRHNAAADAWATAQLWLKAAHAMPGHERMQWHAWRRVARQARWLPHARSL